MKLNKETGWFLDEKTRVSPYCSRRENPADISLIVIHNISLPPGEFGGGYIEQLFLGTLDPLAHDYFSGINREVSAHIVIDRLGQLTQYVSFLDKAWHAGQSSYGGREKCNDFSIGIELEGDDNQPFTKDQYSVLIELLRVLLAEYPGLSQDRIVGHSDIAPQRKTDPGPYFDWRYLKENL